MFIRVKYGDGETLLCNPNCTVINLLTSIKTHSKLTDSDTVIDLTDDTGRFPSYSISFDSHACNALITLNLLYKLILFSALYLLQDISGRMVA